jgi:hypothetical protein
VDEPTPLPPALIPLLTTEHFTLQSARSVIIAEIGTRATMYLSAVSSAVVALAFVTTLSDDERIIRGFALVLLPVLWFMGHVTRVRLSQLTYADLYYQRAINRIRHFYVDVSPEAARYLTLSTHDDLIGVGQSTGHSPGREMNFLTAAQMIAVVHYVITGLLGGLLLAWLARANATTAILFGVAVGLVLGVFDYARAGRRFWRYVGGLEVRFPSPPDEPLSG